MAGELIVLSGGLDSAVCMALADRERRGRRERGGGRTPDSLVAVSFDFGQRQRNELDHAAGVAGHYRAEHLIVRTGIPRRGEGRR